MTPPRLIVRYFTDTGKHTWARLGRVLAQSAAQHCPDWDHDIVEIPAVPLSSATGRQGDVHNTRKLNAWAEAVAAAAPGDRLLLLDADTLIRAPLDDLWDRPFDLAYTTKPKDARLPFNGGVIFLRVSEATQTFMATWQAVNSHLFTTPQDHEVWRPAFGGMNQSAFGMLLLASDRAWPARFKGYRHGLELLRLPCLEWNLENEHWDQFDPARTRIVHYKDHLQRALFGGGMDSKTYAPLITEWLAVEDATAAVSDVVVADTRPEQTTQICPCDLTIPERMMPVSRRARRALRRPQEGAA